MGARNFVINVEDLAAAHAVALVSILKRQDEEQRALADRVREDVVVPVCRRFQLTFTSKADGFFLFAKRGQSSQIAAWLCPDDLKLTPGNGRAFHVRDLTPAAKDALRPVLELLNKPLTNVSWLNNVRCLGHLVEDVQ